MEGRIDFTGCRRVMGKAYSGANGKKIAVEYEGPQYMLKFPPSGQGKLRQMGSSSLTSVPSRIQSLIPTVMEVGRSFLISWIPLKSSSSWSQAVCWSIFGRYLP